MTQHNRNPNKLIIKKRPVMVKALIINAFAITGRIVCELLQCELVAQCELENAVL